MQPCLLVQQLPLKQTVRKPGTRDGSLLATGTETLPPAPTPPPCHPGAITRAPPGPQSLPCRLADLGPSLLPALLSLQPAHPIPMCGLSSPPAEGGSGASMVPRSSALTSRWGGGGVHTCYGGKKSRTQLSSSWHCRQPIAVSTKVAEIRAAPGETRHTPRRLPRSRKQKRRQVGHPVLAACVDPCGGLSYRPASGP